MDLRVVLEMKSNTCLLRSVATKRNERWDELGATGRAHSGGSSSMPALDYFSAFFFFFTGRLIKIVLNMVPLFDFICAWITDTLI